MKHGNFAHPKAHLLLAAMGAGFVALSGPAIAQPIEEIVVTAPPIYEEVANAPSANTGPSDRITVTHYINYSGLDLTTDAGVAELESRVQNSAEAVCKQLDKLYPLITPDKDCVREAAEGGMQQVRAAIADAREGAKEEDMKQE